MDQVRINFHRLHTLLFHQYPIITLSENQGVEMENQGARFYQTRATAYLVFKQFDA